MLYPFLDHWLHLLCQNYERFVLWTKKRNKSQAKQVISGTEKCTCKGTETKKVAMSKISF